jgi:hypothetical protein
MPNLNVFFSPILGAVDAQLTLNRFDGIATKMVKVIPDYEAYTSEDSGQLVIGSSLKATAKASDFADVELLKADELVFGGKAYRIRAKAFIDDGQLVMLTLNCLGAC